MRKTIYISLFFSLLYLFTNKANAQCPDAPLFVISSHVQLDAFLTAFPDCTDYEGHLRISPGISDITNLGGLQNLQSVQDLEIEGTQLTDLSGLENLTSIGGALRIVLNNSLTNFSGLENLTSIGGALEIRQNNSLTSFNGLNNLTTVGGEFWEAGNPLVTNFTGLENLTFVGGNLNIRVGSTLSSVSDLNNLTSIGGDLTISPTSTTVFILENLTSIGGDLRVSGNFSLTNLNFLSNLTSIGMDLELTTNFELTDISGLSNVLTVGGDLVLYENTVLTNLNDLDNLNFVGGDLILAYNFELEFCSTPAICELIVNSGGDIFIVQNAPGCFTEEEILSTCNEVGKINLHCYYDLNENGEQDSGEFFLPAVSAAIEPGGITLYGRPERPGIKHLFFGDYTVTLNEDNSPNWTLTNGVSSYDVTLDSINNRDTVYFGLIPNNTVSLLSTSCVNAQPRCNEFTTFEPMAINNGTVLSTGTLWFTVDSNILDVDFIDPPDTIVGTDRFGWFFTDLFPQQIFKKQILLRLPGPPDFPIGDFLNFEISAEYSDELTTLEWTTNTHQVELLCAYDPNDKLVQPIYPDNYALTGEDLIYTIRFQNTGNAEAYDVVIKDVLSENLDLSSFRYLTSSHESVLQTEITGRMLTFEFRDIFLPDSTTNFDESQGYVMYSIRALETLQDFSTIENTANIFFDFNPAVVTNTTENIMVESFDADGDGFEIWLDCDDTDVLINPAAAEIPFNRIDENCDGEDLLISTEDILTIKPQVFPNPTSGLLQVIFPVAVDGVYSLSDLSGRILLEGDLRKEMNLDLSGKPQGVYMLLIKIESGVWVERIVRI